MKALLPSVVVCAGFLVLAGSAFQSMAQSSATSTAPGAVAPASAGPPDVDLKIPSAASASGESGSPCVSGNAAASPANNLQLSSAPLGVLVGKLHSQGAEPFLVGNKKEIKVEEQGHLFLAVNAGNPPACQEILAAKVHLASAAMGQTTAPPKDVKSKLAAAAQTWIAGQFGAGALAAESPAVAGAAATSANSAAGISGSPASAAKPLNISTAPLDPKLRDAIDHLPRRVYDQLKNLGDMVNFVMIGSQKNVQAALQAANWFVADTSNSGAVTKAILMTYENKDYLQMPMSQLYLFGRVQDFGYEQAE